jgi:hypothetical protein
MPFPLPIDSDFRKEIVNSWILDVYDRLEIGDLDGAEKSWKTATNIYLSLPGGDGSLSLDERLFQARVKINSSTH